MLKNVVDTVPEGLEQAYIKQDDGTFKLDYDIPTDTKSVALQKQLDASKDQVNEFRVNNRRLFNENTELKNDTEGTSTEVLAELDDLRESNSQFESKYVKAQAHLEQVVLTDSVSTAAIKYGVQDSALIDVTNRAKTSFNVVDGKAVHVTDKKDEAGNPLSVSDWMKSLSESAPHLFSQSQGTGTQRPVKGVFSPTMSSKQKIASGLSKR